MFLSSVRKFRPKLFHKSTPGGFRATGSDFAGLERSKDEEIQLLSNEVKQLRDQVLLLSISSGHNLQENNTLVK
jgi:hypothetical protein